MFFFFAQYVKTYYAQHTMRMFKHTVTKGSKHTITCYNMGSLLSLDLNIIDVRLESIVKGKNFRNKGERRQSAITSDMLRNRKKKYFFSPHKMRKKHHDPVPFQDERRSIMMNPDIEVKHFSERIQYDRSLSQYSMQRWKMIQ